MLVRSDLNVPLDDDGNISDPGRINASVPTLKALSDAGAKVVVTAHLGRPKGVPYPKFSLAPVAAALGDKLGRHVQLAGDVVGSDALARAEGLTDGDILLLENVRFDARETSKDDAERTSLANALSELVRAPDGAPGAFVSDGFGVVHRKQASVYDIAGLLPHYAGTLVATEVKVLQQLTAAGERPYAVVLGGSKVSDKLAVIETLATKADSLVIAVECASHSLLHKDFRLATHYSKKAWSRPVASCWTPMVTCCISRWTSWWRTSSRPIRLLRWWPPIRSPTARWGWTSDRSR